MIALHLNRVSVCATLNEMFLSDTFVKFAAICAQSAIYHCLFLGFGHQLSQTIFCDLAYMRIVKKAYMVPAAHWLCFNAAWHIYVDAFTNVYRFTFYSHKAETIRPSPQ